MSARPHLRALASRARAAHQALRAPDASPHDPASLRALAAMALAALTIVVAHYQASTEALVKRWPALWEQPEPQRWVWPQLYTAAVSASLHLAVSLGLAAAGWATLRAAPRPRGGPQGARLWALCVALTALLATASPVLIGAKDWAAPPAPLSGWALWVTAAAAAVRAVSLEVFYRGLLVIGGRDRLGTAGAVGMSLIPWMMAHYHLSLPQALVGWLTGAGLGWLAASRGSIWLCVGLHLLALSARTLWAALA